MHQLYVLDLQVLDVRTVQYCTLATKGVGFMLVLGDVTSVISDVFTNKIPVVRKLRVEAPSQLTW
jgi:hypothetical protein